MKNQLLLFLLLLCASCKPLQRTPLQALSGVVRVISAAPALTEMVCAIGATETLVGRTDACDYPPDLLNNIPVVGKFATPNLEQTIALAPTHLLESFLVDPQKKSTLESFGIRVEHIPCDRMADIPIAIRRIGEITSHRDEAETLARKIESGLAQSEAEVKGQMRHYRTLLLFDPSTPVTCGSNTFVSELTELAGGINIARSLQKDYDNISLEWIVEQDPELIICFFQSSAEPAAQFKNRTGWKEIRAVREGRVLTPADLDLVCRPGPRVLEGISEMRRVIQGET